MTGVEHDEAGRPSESPVNRKKMMEKRLRKLAKVEVSDPIHLQAPHAEPDLLIVGMGSTGGTIDQARKQLEAEGIKTNHVTVRLLHPFPTELVLPQVAKAKKSSCWKQCDRAAGQSDQTACRPSRQDRECAEI
ncbi:hypothetical protein HMSSN036_56260 [Paenibacillus macerans]|nr:hypothetical protein HMSSN036_56260 [Paenibacillus macerans]